MKQKKKFVAQPRERRIVIVGLGGIGSWVLQGLAPYLQYSDKSWSLVLVDGDEYEEKNRTRQAFEELGPKAAVQAGWVARRFSRLRVEAVTQYLSADGAEDTIPVVDAVRSGDIVFSCVDNHGVLAQFGFYTTHGLGHIWGNKFLNSHVQFLPFIH